MAITVSASITVGFNFSFGLKVLVLTGATEAGGATASGVLSASLTPNSSNSLIALGLYNETSSTAFTAASNNTFIDNAAENAGTQVADGNYSGTVTSGVAVTVGATAPTSQTTEMGAYEVPPSGGSTPSIDGSTPALAVVTTGTSVTTASFTPPAGAVLVAILMTDPATATPGLSVSDTSSLTWTQRIVAVNGTLAMAAIYTATVPGGAAPPPMPPAQAWPVYQQRIR